MENNAIKKPDFYVIGSGKLVSVRTFAKKCFKFFGLNYKDFVKVDKKLLRPSKTSNLKANFSKAKNILVFIQKQVLIN